MCVLLLLLIISATVQLTIAEIRELNQRSYFDLCELHFHNFAKLLQNLI